MLASIENFTVTALFKSIRGPCPKNWFFSVDMQSPGFDQITLLFLQLLKLPWASVSRGVWLPSCSGSTSISTEVFVGHSSQMHSACGGRKPSRKENGPASLRAHLSRYHVFAAFHWAKQSDLERLSADRLGMEPGFALLCSGFVMTFLFPSREWEYFPPISVYLTRG